MILQAFNMPAPASQPAVAAPVLPPLPSPDAPKPPSLAFACLTVDPVSSSHQLDPDARPDAPSLEPLAGVPLLEPSPLIVSPRAAVSSVSSETVDLTSSSISEADPAPPAAAMPVLSMPLDTLMLHPTSCLYEQAVRNDEAQPFDPCSHDYERCSEAEAMVSASVRRHMSLMMLRRYGPRMSIVVAQVRLLCRCFFVVHVLAFLSFCAGCRFD